MMFLLVVIYIVFISLGLPDSLFGVAWPVVHKEFGIAENFASLYSIITGVCTGGVSFIAGKLLRKFGTGRITFFSTLLTVIGMLLMSFSQNIVVMMLGAVILGYGAGVIDTGLNTFASVHYESKHINWLHACWGVGVTLSPMIMSAFLSDGASSWRNGYRAVALIQSAIALIVLFSLKKWKTVEENTVNVDEPKKTVSKSFIEIIKTKGLITSILSLGFYCGMEFTVGTWGASFLVNVFALSPDEAARWVSLYFGGIMTGRIISGFVSSKASDDTMVTYGAVSSILGMILLVLPLGKASLFGLLLIGIGFGPVFPCTLHNVPSRFGTEYAADLTGYHMGGAYGLGFAIQLCFGFVATSTTFKITPFVLLAVCLSLLFTHKITIKKLKHK